MLVSGNSRGQTSMKKIVIFILIVFASCGPTPNCVDKMDPAKITWDKIRYADFIDSLKISTKRTSLNGVYLSGDLNNLISKLNPKVGYAIHDCWDGGSLGGIIIKDTTFLFQNLLSMDICDNIYGDWFCYGLDTSLLPPDYKIVQTITGPNNWYFIRTTKEE
jgi:hypothetical protein